MAAPDRKRTEQFAEAFHELTDNVNTVVCGKRETVALAVACLLCEGHLLVEDVPGVGKTVLARCLAASVGGSVRRLQFTPDLLPSDITGTLVLRRRDGSDDLFEFEEGPVFANVVIADEINRAAPKVQSALLEVMEERRVSIAGVSHPVPRPFLVVATENPVEMDGTYPLPEAQLDRFLMRVRLGYPDHQAELDVLARWLEGRTPEKLVPRLSAGDVTRLAAVARAQHIDAQVRSYLVELVAATRSLPDVRLGVSPRGTIALLRAAQVRAASQGREFVLPDDIQKVADPVLAHRLILTTQAAMAGVTATDLIEKALSDVRPPSAPGGVR
ncbi:MoxR-like ATPase [Frankia sp. Hr75.2]|nr:MoxR-like ATPase [Frankia sp. Hr75.2]